MEYSVHSVATSSGSETWDCDIYNKDRLVFCFHCLDRFAAIRLAESLQENTIDFDGGHIQGEEKI